MSKYGMRSFSGPFDWLFSDFQGVIHFMETNFSDFLCKENLISIENKPKEFADIKYGLYFLHDVKKDFEQEYYSIHEKYLHRIKNFQLKVKKGVCFIRAVRDAVEMDYISSNFLYINQVIKKDNINNEIIYLIPQFLNIPHNLDQKYYSLKINLYQGNYREGLRGLFDTNENFISYCLRNYPEDIYKDNIIFDLKAELNLFEKRQSIVSIERKAVQDIDNAYMQAQINESRCQRLLKLLRTDFSKLSMPIKIDIYGAGDIGKIFYDKIKQYVSVGCFIDKMSYERTYKDIPIIRLSDYIPQKDATIVVIPTYAFKEVYSDLNAINNVNTLNIIPLEMILKS